MTILDPLAMEKIPSNILQRQAAGENKMEDGARFWLTKAGADELYINVDGDDSIYLKNSRYVVFLNVAGDRDSYIFRDSADTLNIANLKAGEEVILVVTMASTNQRTLRLREDASTNNLMLQFGYDTVFKTDNGDIELRPADHVIITDMATSDPHIVGALWNSSGTVKISAG